MNHTGDCSLVIGSEMHVDDIFLDLSYRPARYSVVLEIENRLDLGPDIQEALCRLATTKEIHKALYSQKY